MFGIGRWFKKTKVGKHYENAKDQLEGLFDEAGFGEVFDECKGYLEDLVRQAEATIVAAGASKFAWVFDQLTQKFPEARKFIGLIRRWATAYVENKKAEGLWK